jgi:hypothetical protein
LSTINASPVEIFVRSDNTPSLHAGQSYSQFMCALFTGTFSTGCGSGGSVNNIVKHNPGPITSFLGFTTPIGSTNKLWWVYTARFGNVLTWDRSLFFTYDSQFVSGYAAIQTSTLGGHCSTKSLGSFAPGNYMYVCNESYDSLAGQAENAPCQTAPGDPSTGQTRLTVTFANCPGITPAAPSAASAAYKAQDTFGQNAYTIPLWSGKNQFAYLNGWQRGVLHNGNGFTPPGNFFTTLDARNAAPPVAGTIRQGYSQTTGSVNPFIGGVNPFIGNTAWDEGVIGSIYDRPGYGNPSVPSSYVDWMTISTTKIDAGSLGYTPPGGACINGVAGNPPGCTVAGFRYHIRHDNYWQFDTPVGTSGHGVPGSLSKTVTAWDIAFSYIAYKANGVMPGLGLMTGVHVVSTFQIDLLVSAVGPNTALFLSSPVIPARSWTSTCPGPKSTVIANWDEYAFRGAASTTPEVFHVVDDDMSKCIAPAGSITSLGPGAGNLIVPTGSTVNTTRIQPGYDVVASADFIGSGPWVCKSGGNIGGPGCSSSNNSAPPIGGSWTFVRYGQGTTPGTSLSTYFRSNSNLALWIWSGNTGDFPLDSQLFSRIVGCNFVTPVPATCLSWSMGVGNPAGSASSPAVITGTQFGIVTRFLGITWSWRTSPLPQNIGTFPPVLYEGSATLNPSSVVGCSIPFSSGGGYDC